MTIKLKCPAKINLHLEVGVKRDDGFHNISSFIHAVDIWDYLEVSESNKFSFSYSKKSSQPLKTANYDLEKDHIFFDIYRSAQKTFPAIPKAISVELEKHIPIGGGLGGASSNIAGILLAVANFVHIDFLAKRNEALKNSGASPPDEFFPENRIEPGGAKLKNYHQLSEELKNWLLDEAKKWGSDVPFFFEGGFAYVFGRGEKVWKLRSLANMSCLLYSPAIHVSTKEAYRKNLPMGKSIHPLGKRIANYYRKEFFGREPNMPSGGDSKRITGDSSLFFAFLDKFGGNTFFRPTLDNQPHMASAWALFLRSLKKNLLEGKLLPSIRTDRKKLPIKILEINTEQLQKDGFNAILEKSNGSKNNEVDQHIEKKLLQTYQKKKLNQELSVYVGMSGSGSTYFGLFHGIMYEPMILRKDSDKELEEVDFTDGLNGGPRGAKKLDPSPEKSTGLAQIFSNFFNGGNIEEFGFEGNRTISSKQNRGKLFFSDLIGNGVETI